jgi:hypothetical protein
MKHSLTRGPVPQNTDAHTPHKHSHTLTHTHTHTQCPAINTLVGKRQRGHSGITAPGIFRHHRLCHSPNGVIGEGTCARVGSQDLWRTAFRRSPTVATCYNDSIQRSSIQQHVCAKREHGMGNMEGVEGTEPGPRRHKAHTPASHTPASPAPTQRVVLATFTGLPIATSRSSTLPSKL